MRPPPEFVNPVGKKAAEGVLSTDQQKELKQEILQVNHDEGFDEPIEEEIEGAEGTSPLVQS